MASSLEVTISFGLISSFHRIQEELEKRGYIERRKVGKAYLISLTQRGRLILEFMGR